jgi:hypothetical protein
MNETPSLIVQLPRAGEAERLLRAAAIPSVADGTVVVEAGPTDERGNLEPPIAGEVVMSVPSPESLAREPDAVRRVIDGAGPGTEPLVVVVEAAEELREEELTAVLEAARRSSRAVILRIIRDG